MAPEATKPARLAWPAARAAPPRPAASRGTHRLRLGRLAPIVAMLVVIGVGWWYLAPPQLAGSTSLVTVDGTSMLPGIQPSDLVGLRPTSTYRVGDVVGYQSHLLHRVVLHRIVAIHNGHYTFKGDNNSFLDPEHPTQARLVGKRWFQIPTAGKLVGLFHIPWVLAAVAALFVVLLGLGGHHPATDQE